MTQKIIEPGSPLRKGETERKVPERKPSHDIERFPIKPELGHPGLHGGRGGKGTRRGK